MSDEAAAAADDDDDENECRQGYCYWTCCEHFFHFQRSTTRFECDLTECCLRSMNDVEAGAYRSELIVVNVGKIQIHFLEEIGNAVGQNVTRCHSAERTDMDRATADPGGHRSVSPIDRATATAVAAQQAVPRPMPMPSMWVVNSSTKLIQWTHHSKRVFGKSSK